MKPARLAACVLTAVLAATATGCSTPTDGPAETGASASPAAPGTPTGADSSPADTTSPTNIPTQAAWTTTTIEGRTVTTPDTWEPTVTPGGDASWLLPDGTAAAVTFTSPTPTTITDQILTQTAQSIVQAAPQLTLTQQTPATPTQGSIVFREGNRTLHVWLISTPQGVWTVTLGQPYQVDGAPQPSPATTPPNPTPQGAAQVEQFIQRNTTPAP